MSSRSWKKGVKGWLSRSLRTKLSRLNGTAAVFEHETDASGETEPKTLEWE